VARSPRQQRRARRAEQNEQAAGQRSRSRQQQVRPAAQPQKQQTGRREAKQRGRFARESAAELRKVEWPGRSQVIQGTVVVIIACAIVGAYLYVADAALSRLVEQII
jgi:preprotein translocase subunit SecE